ncbi:hypothetical protein FQR65_LT19428 [Abscondita terminalis]|nr:hypothetical protein FQR65_LT19428 [Abscondita terminalis]
MGLSVRNGANFTKPYRSYQSDLYIKLVKLTVLKELTLVSFLWTNISALAGKMAYRREKDELKSNVYGQCLSWLKSGLQPRSMTRDLDWGVDVPLEEAEGIPFGSFWVFKSCHKSKTAEKKIKGRQYPPTAHIQPMEWRVQVFRSGRWIPSPAKQYTVDTSVVPATVRYKKSDIPSVNPDVTAATGVLCCAAGMLKQDIYTDDLINVSNRTRSTGVRKLPITSTTFEGRMERTYVTTKNNTDPQIGDKDGKVGNSPTS